MPFLLKIARIFFSRICPVISKGFLKYEIKKNSLDSDCVIGWLGDWLACNMAYKKIGWLDDCIAGWVTRWVRWVLVWLINCLLELSYAVSKIKKFKLVLVPLSSDDLCNEKA